MNIDQYRALKAQEATQATEQPSSVQSEVDTKAETTIENKTVDAVENKPTQSEEESKPSDSFFIEGIGNVTFDELKNGYLRQSDYTRKTQDVAKQRNEFKDAVAFYDFLKHHPEVAKQVVEVTKGSVPRALDPAQAQVLELQEKVYDMQLELEISKLQNKYSDFDVREVLQMAQKQNITDLEAAYKLVKADKSPSGSSSTVDVETLKTKLRDEILKELAEESKSTKTIITTNNGGQIIRHNQPAISETEKLVAKKMRLSDEEYIKWRDASKKKRGG